MNQLLKEFGRRLDDIAAHATVNEGVKDVVISGLQVEDAKSLAIAADLAELSWSAEDGADTFVNEIAAFDEDLAPFRMTVNKPVNGTSFVLFTLNALRRSLERDEPNALWKHVQSTHSFSTVARRFSTWDDPSGPAGDALRRPQPRELVRESGDPSAPARISPWLLDLPLSHLPVGDPVFDEWSKVSVLAAVRSLASEILADGTLVYSGPPKLKVALSQVPAPSKELLVSLQRAIKWVFESDHQAEIRHGLIGAELGRHCIEKSITAAGVAAALEGAKIAYQLLLSGISKDSLKAIAEVRKAVTEEINKTADTARQLATAVAGAVFLGLGVVAARVTSTAPPSLLIALSIVLAIYVGAMIYASNHFMALQEGLRSDWKQRFFGFLGTDDYRTLVTEPLQKARKGFVVVSWLAGGISVAMVLAVIVFVSWDFSEEAGSTTPDPAVTEAS